MLSFIEMLDKAQKTCSPATGNGLASALKVEPSAVSNWKHGRAYPNVVACEQIAQMIGEPPLRVIAQVNEMRAISKSEKAVWKRIAMAALLGLFCTPAWAGPGHAVSGISVAELALIASPIRHYAKFWGCAGFTLL